MTTKLSGREAVHASRLARQEKERAFEIPDTYGPLFSVSSPSESLQSCLENKLRQAMDVSGSPEYELTWKRWDMSAGPQICALRASARRTSGKGSSGWPSPKAHDATGRSPKNDDLTSVVRLAGWDTPTARDHRDGRSGASMESNVGINGVLGRQVRLLNAEMGKCGGSRLNPAFSLWLMMGHSVARILIQTAPRGRQFSKRRATR